LVAVAAIAVWQLVRPGVFTVQPIGGLLEGMTCVYHSRDPETPFFSSPDGLCLKKEGAVTLLCRGIAFSITSELMDRTIIRLPYSRWAYLQSTGGLEFE